MMTYYFSAESPLVLNGFLTTVKLTETRAYRAVFNKLEQRHHVVILGRPGDGKTTIGFKVLHAIKEKYNSNPLIPQNQVLDFLPQLPDEKYFSIFLDDMFGVYTVSEQPMRRSLVYQILSLLRKGNFLVVSMRKDIYLQCKKQLPRELFSNDVVVDLTDTDFQLLEEEKRSMLHEISNIDEDTVTKIITHHRFSNQQIGFPQCVEIMKESQTFNFQKVIETPLDYITEQVYHLFENCREKFLVLVMTFINQGQINDDDVDRLRPVLPDGVDDCTIKSQQIKQAFRNLDTTYLKKTERVLYSIQHESVMEGMARSLWENLGCRDFFIETCPERFLTRLSNIKSDEMTNEEDQDERSSKKFFIHKEQYIALFKRLQSLLESGQETSFLTVANLDLWDNPGATSQFVHFIKQCNQYHKDCNGESLLPYAAMQGRFNLLRLLLEDADEETGQLRLALLKATRHCHIRVVKYLLSRTSDPVDLNLIFHAIHGKSVEIFQAISSTFSHFHLKLRRESMICDFFSGLRNIEVNIIEEIILSGSIILLEYIIDHYQINFNQMVLENPRIVEFAAYSGSIDLMQFLFNCGCEICPHLLWWNTHSGSIDMLKYLLKKGCRFNQNEYISCDGDINQLNDLHGLNEMHGACFSGNRKLVMHLFETNPEFMQMKDSDGSTPALLSPWSGSLDIVKYMDTKSDITSVDLYGQNIIHHAAWHGQQDIVIYLTDKYQSLVYMKDQLGRTPLHHAGWSGSEDIVDYLISKDCDVLDKTNTGKTILHNACKERKFTLLKHLSENYPALLIMRDNTGTDTITHSWMVWICRNCGLPR